MTLKRKKIMQDKNLLVAALGILVILMAACILILSVSLLYRNLQESRIDHEITFLEEPFRYDRIGEDLIC